MSEYQGCDNCRYVNRTKDEFPCFECTHNAIDRWKPMTNADRIRNFSDEELAEFLAELNACEKCKYDSSMGCLFENPCTKSFAEAMALEWLKAEVEEGE